MGRLYTKDDHTRIICPFLDALVNEGKMAVKTSYHRDELRDVTIAAGLDPATTEKHIQSNFKDIPSGLIDIFDMEGLPNEHWTSTGINDCTTHVSNCRTHRDGHKACSEDTHCLFWAHHRWSGCHRRTFCHFGDAGLGLSKDQCCRQLLPIVHLARRSLWVQSESSGVYPGRGLACSEDTHCLF